MYDNSHVLCSVLFNDGDMLPLRRNQLRVTNIDVRDSFHFFCSSTSENYRTVYLRLIQNWDRLKTVAPEFVSLFSRLQVSEGQESFSAYS